MKRVPRSSFNWRAILICVRMPSPLIEQADAWGGVLGPEGKKVMTTLRAPYKTRSWSETEVAALRSMVKTGKDARTIGKELSQVFFGYPSQGQET
jgi:hypothetical protein